MGSEIRTFFRELFGSRLVELLETQLLHVRQDFERRLQDKDQVIADLRAEKALMLGRMVIYENTIMPMASRAGAQVVSAINPSVPKKPTFNVSELMSQLPKSPWEVEQERYYKQRDEEDKAAEAAKQSGTSADRS